MITGNDRLLIKAGLLLTLLPLCLVAHARAASFDCGKAGTAVEKLICADIELSKLDEEVAQSYKNALTRSEEPNLTHDEQVRWLKKRNACGENIACLKAAHKGRVLEVTRDEIDNPSGWWIRTGAGNGICDELHQRLIKYRPEDISGCPRGVVLTLPGIKEAEGWKELNPLDHIELINKLRLYRELHSPDMYFERWGGQRGSQNSDDAQHQMKKAEDIRARLKPYLYSREYVETAVQERGLRLRTQTLKLFRHTSPDGTGSVERQTLLEIRFIRTKPGAIEPFPFLREWETEGNCPLPQRDTVVIHTYFVAPDLSGPDPDMGGREENTARDGLLVDYKDNLYFMHTVGGDVYFTGSSKDGDVTTFCEIQWRPSSTRWPELDHQK